MRRNYYANRAAAASAAASRSAGGGRTLSVDATIVLAVLGAVVVLVFATFVYLLVSRDTNTLWHPPPSPFLSSSSSSSSSLLLPSQQWNWFGRTSPTTPPLQDNLDRIIPNPIADMILAPNGLARMRAAGASSSSSVMLPISVRPPIDRTYKQVGTLTRQRAAGGDVENADLDILPLMGQMLQGDKYRYFTIAGGNKMAVERNGGGGSGIGGRRKTCSGEYGCNEIYDTDVLSVTGFKDKFVTNMWENGTFYS